jgi:hypothetical protein
MMLALSLWGGFVNYLGRIKSGVVKRFDFIELIAELSICSFAGITVGFIAMSFDVHPFMSFALAAVAGHAGGRTVYFMDRFFQKKLAALSKNADK